MSTKPIHFAPTATQEEIDALRTRLCAKLKLSAVIQKHENLFSESQEVETIARDIARLESRITEAEEEGFIRRR